jgi:hypothetical protein
MREHARCRLLLYDYVMKELQGAQRARVEQHVRHCRECAESLERLRETCKTLERRPVRQSRLQSERYWENFAARVDARLPETDHRRLRLPHSVVAALTSALQIRPRFAFGTAVAVAAAVVALFILRPATTIDVEPEPEVHTTQRPPSEQNSERLGNYLRQSRALLVGLTNKDTPAGRQIDLEPERHASRRLLEQSRHLRLQHLDARSANLVNDVERIMIKLANTEGTGTTPDLTLIQNGIRDRNLLFKVRMAEQAYASSRCVYAGDRR